MRYYKGLGAIFFLISFSSFFLGSCISPKSIAYFNNLPDTAKIILDSLQPPQPVILINDVLEIKLGGENEKTVQYINQYFSGGTAIVAAGATGPQFTVDVDGNINLPKLGKVKMAGLTREQAQDTLTYLYKQFLQEPIVAVKFSNFHFSVLGEVRSPGSFISTNEKISIFEALAQAGDITNLGHFENVRIIRDVNGSRSVITVNLLDKSILNSENYYIHRYDVIYVQSRNLKEVTDNFSRTATFIATITSVLAIVFILFKS